MDYVAYNTYKNSGSYWLGEIPSHWEVKKLKFVATVQPSNVDKKTVEGEEEVLLCNYTDVYKNEYIDSNLVFMRATATASEIKKFKVDTDDVIVTKDSEDPRDIAVPACASEKVEGLLCGYHLTQIKSLSVYGRYVFRLFQSRGFNAQFIVAANGVTRFGLPQHAISNAFAPVPPPEEQQTIAAFLDYKTVKIDALIAKKKALLDKLLEKRTALISHAVTKGLDPKVPMRDSDIDWLGEIPAHWEMNRLKFLATVQPSNVDKKTIEGEEAVLLCNYTDVYKNEYIDHELEFMRATATPAEIRKFAVDIDDVIVTKDSEDPEDIAIPACVAEKVEDLLCGYHLTQIKPLHMHGRYLFRLFQSKGFNAHFIVSANGVTRFGLPQYAISNVFTPTPPINEQIEIAEYIDDASVRIEKQKRMIVGVIGKLKEYRSALITNAVTGKIDVRNFRLPEAEELVNHG